MNKHACLVLMLVVFSFSGCATVDGFKQDVKNMTEGTSKSGSWINNVDNWIKENMW